MAFQIKDDLLIIAIKISVSPQVLDIKEKINLPLYFTHSAHRKKLTKENYLYQVVQ